MRTSEQADGGPCWTHWHLHRGCIRTVVPVQRVQESVRCVSWLGHRALSPWTMCSQEGERRDRYNKGSDPESRQTIFHWRWSAAQSDHNLITPVYILDEYVPCILNIDATREKLYEEYVSERINGDVSLWAPVKKQNNKTFIIWQQERQCENQVQPRHCQK